MAKKYNYTETKMIRDIAKVMADNKGPFTKKMLIELLKDEYPKLGIQELKNEFSTAFLVDKHCNQRFVYVSRGVWDLRDRPGDGTTPV